MGQDVWNGSKPQMLHEYTNHCKAPTEMNAKLCKCKISQA